MERRVQDHGKECGEESENGGRGSFLSGGFVYIIPLLTWGSVFCSLGNPPANGHASVSVQRGVGQSEVFPSQRRLSLSPFSQSLVSQGQDLPRLL